MDAAIRDHGRTARCSRGGRDGRIAKAAVRSVTVGQGEARAARVGYVYFEEFGIVLLVISYVKNEQDNLSADDKRIIRDMIRREREALERRPYH